MDGTAYGSGDREAEGSLEIVDDDLTKSDDGKPSVGKKKKGNRKASKEIKTSESSCDVSVRLISIDGVGCVEGTGSAFDGADPRPVSLRKNRKKKDRTKKRDGEGSKEQKRETKLSDERVKEMDQEVKKNASSRGTPGRDPVGSLTRGMMNLSTNSPEQDSSSPRFGSRQWSPRKRTDQSNNNTKREAFEEYLSEEDTLKGLESGILIKGDVRINPKNFKEAYISDPDDGQDIAILGVGDRNRALEGDIVAIEIKNKEDWHKQDNGKIQRTAKVVRILEMVHSRIGVGFLKNLEKNYALFCPRDHRVPRLQIPLTTIPMEIIQNPEMYRDTLFTALIITWTQPQMAQGVIKDQIGEKGNLKTETDAILLQLGLNSKPVDPVFNKYLPKIPFTITQEEINSRLDLRRVCIFSIDPETARDLDDAVSVEVLGNDEYRVGVHISDVSYFLETGTPLDVEVAGRATTTYMVQGAIHMLPLELCMLCSLLPGQDKLTMSVLWTMDSQGRIKGEPKFARSVIHSCAQLAYEHAQAIIEGKRVELPIVHNGFTEQNIKESVLLLNKIATSLRKQRFEGGALRIDQPKTFFTLDAHCNPIDVKLYELKDSNRLIEEFMLLANTTVARHLSHTNPKIALLRRHSPPKKEMLYKLEQSLHKLGIFLKIETAGELHESISLCSEDNIARQTVLNALCSKPMCRALYFCFSQDTHHYALNVDLYTHFTSPIRRYADIVVHRLLASVLGYTKTPPWTTDEVRAFANNCNKKKYAAKKAGELSSELFSAILIKNAGSYNTKGIVCGVYSYSFEAIILDLALNVKVYTQTLDGTIEFTEEGAASSMVVKWNSAAPQLIQIFSVVDLVLSVMPDSNLIKGELLPTAAISIL